MELSPYLHDIAADLDKVTALADEPTREIAGRLVSALESSLRMALVRAVSDALAIVSAELDGVTAMVRLDGGDPVIVVDASAQAPSETPPSPDEGDEGARITVRLPQSLKERAEIRAAEADQSLNAWIVQAIRRAAHEDPFVSAFTRGRMPGARRVTGWA
jgi:hypothetical protein